MKFRMPDLEIRMPTTAETIEATTAGAAAAFETSAIAIYFGGHALESISNSNFGIEIFEALSSLSPNLSNILATNLDKGIDLLNNSSELGIIAAISGAFSALVGIGLVNYLRRND
jgi:hypothetical protein